MNKKYQVIYADPPWKYGNWGKGSQKMYAKGFTDETSYSKPLPYKCMDVGKIKKLPVKQITNENCELYLWTTQKYLADAFKVLGSWGFKYCQTLAWCKEPRGTGQGGMYCPTTEFLILGRRGKMPLGKRRVDTTWWKVKRPHNSHSTKPEFFRNLVKEMSNPPRMELFARQKTEGWDVWGNEVESDITL